MDANSVAEAVGQMLRGSRVRPNNASVSNPEESLFVEQNAGEDEELVPSGRRTSKLCEKIEPMSSVFFLLSFVELVLFCTFSTTIQDRVYGYLEWDIGNSSHRDHAYNASLLACILLIVPHMLYSGLYAVIRKTDEISPVLSFNVYSAAVAASDFGMVWAIATNVGIWDCWALVSTSLVAFLAVISVNEIDENSKVNWFMSGVSTVYVSVVLLINMWYVKSALPFTGEVLATVYISLYLLRFIVSLLYCLTANVDGLELVLRAGAKYIGLKNITQGMTKSDATSLISRADHRERRRLLFVLDGWAKAGLVIILYFVGFYYRGDLP